MKARYFSGGQLEIVSSHEMTSEEWAAVLLWVLAYALITTTVRTAITGKTTHYRMPRLRCLTQLALSQRTDFYMPMVAMPMMVVTASCVEHSIYSK